MCITVFKGHVYTCLMSIIEWGFEEGDGWNVTNDVKVEKQSGKSLGKSNSEGSERSAVKSVRNQRTWIFCSHSKLAPFSRNSHQLVLGETLGKRLLKLFRGYLAPGSGYMTKDFWLCSQWLYSQKSLIQELFNP